MRFESAAVLPPSAQYLKQCRAIQQVSNVRQIPSILAKMFQTSATSGNSGNFRLTCCFNCSSQQIPFNPDSSLNISSISQTITCDLGVAGSGPAETAGLRANTGAVCRQGCRPLCYWLAAGHSRLMISLVRILAAMEVNASRVASAASNTQNSLILTVSRWPTSVPPTAFSFRSA